MHKLRFVRVIDLVSVLKQTSGLRPYGLSDWVGFGGVGCEFVVLHV